MDTIQIGLFPLKIVLLPESLLSFHIFEERYKLLIKDCWTNNKPFGVNLKISSKIYDVGCSAVINDITKTYEDGRMDIIITGMKKYRLSEYNPTPSGFLAGTIQYVDDNEEMIDFKALAECINVYNHIACSINISLIDKIVLEDLKTQYPSYLIAQKSGLDIGQRQMFLEMNSENKRIQYLIDHFQKVLPIVEEAEFVSKIMKNDGYYKPKKLNI